MICLETCRLTYDKSYYLNNNKKQKKKKTDELNKFNFNKNLFILSIEFNIKKRLDLYFISKYSIYIFIYFKK